MRQRRLFGLAVETDTVTVFFGVSRILLRRRGVEHQNVSVGLNPLLFFVVASGFGGVIFSAQATTRWASDYLAPPLRHRPPRNNKYWPNAGD